MNIITKLGQRTNCTSNRPFIFFLRWSISNQEQTLSRKQFVSYGDNIGLEFTSILPNRLLKSWIKIPSSSSLFSWFLWRWNKASMKNTFSLRVLLTVLYLRSCTEFQHVHVKVPILAHLFDSIDGHKTFSTTPRLDFRKLSNISLGIIPDLFNNKELSSTISWWINNRSNRFIWNSLTETTRKRQKETKSRCTGARCIPLTAVYFYLIKRHLSILTVNGSKVDISNRNKMTLQSLFKQGPAYWHKPLIDFLSKTLENKTK